MNDKIKQSIQASISLKQKVLGDEEFLGKIERAGAKWAEVLKRGGKILFCGNGGSAADSQHLAAEIVGRFKMERRGLPSIALTTDSSILTAVANDYGYDRIFERQVEALGTDKDLLVGISTSGNSPNVLAAFKKAKEMRVFTVGFFGKDGGQGKALCDLPLVVQDSDTARVQEVHILIGHILCDLAETALYGK